MTNSEFISKVEELGFRVERINDYVSIRDSGWTVASVRIDKVYYMDTSYGSFNNLNDDLKKKLFSILSEYTSTSIFERMEIIDDN